MRLRTLLGRRRGIRSVMPWESSAFWRTTSKKGLTVGWELMPSVGRDEDRRLEGGLKW